jgi:cyanate lyase
MSCPRTRASMATKQRRLKHWIPAFAGMTVGAGVRMAVREQRLRVRPPPWRRNSALLWFPLPAAGSSLASALASDVTPFCQLDFDHMKRADLAEKILDIKREKGWTWKHIADEIGGLSPVLVVGALLGQMKLPKPLAEKAASFFGLSESEKRMLNEVPTRGTPMPPTDPLLYRFYEMVMVNGPALKARIEEEFGDGIMSAIDFDLEIDRLANPKGDRVRLHMSGKFLPYKYYGAEQGLPEYGLKEE